MSNLKIDYNAVKEQKNNLVQVKNDLDQVFEYIESNTNLLRDYWESKTSRDVFESFDSFCKYLKSIKANFETDITFLEQKALNTYETANADITKQIDEHIVV